TILGHFPYQEVAESELAPITNDGRIRLNKAAAKQFQSMITAARKQGINIVPISGFRSIAQQKQLFFEVKAQRGQTTEQRALVSAPPGHSEHHTGYAVDVGDGNVPATNLNTNFENTRAFQWLKNNAAFYSFEMSFPKNNRQGVSYEPWHWRYVGDQKSLETFYKAKTFYPSTAAKKK
ncbi:MAG TPA: M15 family metallopeptidase, partial [Allocoleopsis sp.]